MGAAFKTEKEKKERAQQAELFAPSDGIVNKAPLNFAGKLYFRKNGKSFFNVPLHSNHPQISYRYPKQTNGEDST